MKIDSSIAAIVTGGASGLGLGSVQALRAAGVKVAIFDRNPEAGEKMAAATGSIFCEVDVMSDASLDAAFAKARAANGPARILIACAGGGNARTTIRKDKETGAIELFPTADFLYPRPHQRRRHLRHHHPLRSRHRRAGTHRR